MQIKNTFFFGGEKKGNFKENFKMAKNSKKFLYKYRLKKSHGLGSFKITKNFSKLVRKIFLNSSHQKKNLNFL